MSALLMTAATVPKKTPPRHLKSYSLKQNESPSLVISPSKQNENSSTKASTRSSISGFSSSSYSDSSRNRSYYDPIKLYYADYNSTFSLFERKLHQFNEAVVCAKSDKYDDSVYHALNATLRETAPLWSPTNLDLLRYSYFEKFESKQQSLKANLRQKIPRYMHIIPTDEKDKEKVEDVCLQGSTTNRHTYTPDSEGMLLTLERRLKCAIAKSVDHTVSVRDALHLSSFWDDVYHDIRCDTFEENYYEWLPPRETTQRLIVEVADLVLLRLRMVTCTISSEEVSELTSDERHELAKIFFFYFSESDAVLLECLSRFIHDDFARHIPSFAVCPDSSHVRSLLAVVVACVCDNIKLHFYGHSKATQLTDLFQDCFLCIFNSILVDFSIGDISQLRVSPPQSVKEMSDMIVEKIRTQSLKSSKEKKEKKMKRKFLSIFGV